MTIDALIYFGASFGMAYIVGHSLISLPFRRWLGGTPERREPIPVSPDWAQGPQPIGERIIPAVPGALGPLGDFLCSLIECPACFGFWWGLFCCGVGIYAPPEGFPSLAHRVLWAIAGALCTSGSNFILSRLTRLI